VTQFYPFLMSPQQLAKANTPIPLPPLRSAPPAANFTRVSSLLQTGDRLQMTPLLPARSLPPLQFSAAPKAPATTAVGAAAPVGNTGSLSAQVAQKQRLAAASAEKEWKSGVRESGGANRGPRINQYARNAQFGPGYEWCGFFAAFNLTQVGFKHAPSLASYQKARDFFMYRDYTNKSAATNQRLDDLRKEHQAQGSTRQYFTLQESPNAKYVKDYSRYFSHYNAAANTFNFRNLPIQAGDVALFHHGHVGMVHSYNPQTGKLVTIEGNTSGKGPDGKTWSQAVVMKEYDLSKAADRKRFDGFGRPALGDFK
jgi:hypothetical protein